MSQLWNRRLRRCCRWVLLLVLCGYLCVKFVIFIQRLNIMDESLDANGCPRSAIFLGDDGRMGNQFFEYLQARVFTRQVSRGLFVRRALNDKFASYFQGHSNPTLESVAQLKQVCGKKIYKDFDMSRQMELPKKLRKQPYIILKPGWPPDISPQMWNLLLSKTNELLGEFQWRSFIKDEVTEYIDLITGNYTYSTLVGVHVRMTDYHAHMNKKYGPSKIPGVNYFNKSMSYYRQKYINPLFLVISNDMTWCQNTLNDSDVVFAGKGNETDPGWDLALLTSCDHLIITYGSYGTMAAYFIAGEGEVVAADNFTTKPNMFSENIRKSNWPNWHWMSID